MFYSNTIDSGVHLKNLINNMHLKKRADEKVREKNESVRK
jgi:hypothetical protein